MTKRDKQVAFVKYDEQDKPKVHAEVRRRYPLYVMELLYYGWLPVGLLARESRSS